MPPPDSQPLRTLVTGGAGFIGSHLCDRLLSRGDALTVVDDLSTGRLTNLPSSHPRLRFIEADLRDALREFSKDDVFDEIYHLAATVGVKLVLKDPVRAIENNVDLTSAVLRFALTRSPSGGGVPILIASSSEIYGKSTHAPFSEEDDVLYGPTTAFRWSYACSKAVDEYLALAHHATHHLPAVVVRFFNTVGPRQVGEYGMVLPRFVGAAIENKPIEVYGSGEQTRCFCDVRDVVQALPELLAGRSCHGQVFNLGSDAPISIRDLAERVVRVLGSRSRIVSVPYSEAYARGFEDLHQRRPDLRKIRDRIGFSPRITLDQTIRDIAADRARELVGDRAGGRRGAW